MLNTEPYRVPKLRISEDVLLRTLHDFMPYTGTISTALLLLLLLLLNEADSNWDMLIAPAISLSKNVRHEVRYGPDRHCVGRLKAISKRSSGMSRSGSRRPAVWAHSCHVPFLQHHTCWSELCLKSCSSISYTNVEGITLEEKIISEVTKCLFFYRSPSSITLLLLPRHWTVSWAT